MPRGENVKKVIKIIFGILVTAVILYYSIQALGLVDFRTIRSININWFYIFFAVVAFVGSNLAKGAMYTFGIAKGISFFDAVRFNSVGNALNMVLPFKAGDGLKLSLFPKEYSVSQRGVLFGLSMALDCISIIFFAILALLFSDFTKDIIGYNLDLKALIIVSSIVIFLLGFGGIVIGMRFEKTKQQILDLLKGDIKHALMYNMLSWFLLYVSKVFSLLALDYFTLIPSIKDALLVTVTTNVALVIPAAPGGIGLFEFACVIALTQSNLNVAEATTAGIVIHIIQYIGLVPMGIYYYFKGLKRKNA